MCKEEVCNKERQHNAQESRFAAAACSRTRLASSDAQSRAICADRVWTRLSNARSSAVRGTVAPAPSPASVAEEETEEEAEAEAARRAASLVRLS